VGYVSGTAEIDLAIAIRTAVCRNGVFEVSAGAGVVDASVPESEADETRNKARGVLCAIAAVPER
jgi:anthranilate synthase component 1